MTYTPLLRYAWIVTRFDLDGYDHEYMRYVFHDPNLDQEWIDGCAKQEAIGIDPVGTVLTIFNITGMTFTDDDKFFEAEFEDRRIVAILTDGDATYENAMKAIQEHEMGGAK